MTDHNTRMVVIDEPENISEAEMKQIVDDFDWPSEAEVEVTRIKLVEATEDYPRYFQLSFDVDYSECEADYSHWTENADGLEIDLAWHFSGETNMEYSEAKAAASVGC